MKLNYLEYYFGCFRRLSRLYKKLLSKGLTQIDNVLDISYIMRKLIEFDMLKMIVLDENQLKIFDNIPKPTISVSEKKEKAANLHQRLSRIYLAKNEIDDGLEALKVLSSKKTKSKKDEKILELIPRYYKMNHIRIGKLQI